MRPRDAARASTSTPSDLGQAQFCARRVWQSRVHACGTVYSMAAGVAGDRIGYAQPRSESLENVDILPDHDRALQALAGTNARAEPYSVARRSASTTIYHHSPRGKSPRPHGNLDAYGCAVLDRELLGDVAKPRRHVRARGVGHYSANCSHHTWQTLISAHSLA